MTDAGAVLADEIGFERLSMSVLADRLGVKAPSLYKHVDGLADLTRRIAVQAATELADAVRDATQGRADHDALLAAARAMCTYAREHQGRYVAMNRARPISSDDPLVAARGRLLDSFAAVLSGYRLDPRQRIHALRMVRSVLHGFVLLDLSDGFQLDTEVDESFAWAIDFIDRGLQAVSAPPHPVQRPADHRGTPL